MWSIVPNTPTEVTVSSTGSVIVQYTVTNNSKKNRTLSMTPIQGVTQNTSIGNCSQLFALAPQQSCLLTLNINGNELFSDFKGGPVICEKGNALQCYQPEMKDILNITMASIKQYTIKGSISGLTNSVLKLQNNNGNTLTVAPNSTSFQFPSAFPIGSSYNVTILEQPNGTTCSINNASGVGNSNVTNVIIVCSTQTFSIGGSISGLSAGVLQLQNNSGDTLNVSANALSFAFITEIPLGGSYNVTIATQPTGLICSVSKGQGSTVIANVNSIAITCSPVAQSYQIGGAINGLHASGLVLRNNGGDDLTINANDNNFQFSQKVPLGGSYAVTVLTQPAGQTCSVTFGSGSSVMSNINSVIITCQNQSFSINGSISGLTSDGLVLRNNGGDDLTVLKNQSIFNFSNPIASGASYNVTVFQQPLNLICTVSNGSGSNVMSNVSNITITCQAQSYKIEGAITGLGNNNGLVLQNNGGDNINVDTNAMHFLFPTNVASGGSYNVTVRQQPQGLICTVTNGSGSNVTSDVNNVSVICNSQSFTISGTISGLTANGLVLQNNGTNNINVPANATAFSFSTPVASGTSYNVTISQQPTGLNCVVSNGSGSNVTTPINSVVVNCSPSLISYAYVANYGNIFTGVSSVSICTINSSNHTIDTCTTKTDSSFSHSVGITLNPNYNFLYVQNGATISSCAVQNAGATIGACVTKNFGGDATNGGGIIVDAGAHFLYSTNYDSKNVSVCQLKADGSGIVNCSVSNDPSFVDPNGITLSKDGSHAFIINFTNCKISSCLIGASGGLSNCTTYSGINNSNSCVGIGINDNGDHIYVTKSSEQELPGTPAKVYICPINNGAVGACTSSTDNIYKFSIISSKLFMSSPNNFGYLPNGLSNNILTCPITNSGASLSTCVASANNSTFNLPVAITVMQ